MRRRRRVSADARDAETRRHPIQRESDEVRLVLWNLANDLNGASLN